MVARALGAGRPYLRLGAAVGFSILAGLWFGFNWGGQHLTNFGDDLLQFVLPGIAAVTTMNAARRARDRRRWTWALVAASCACFAAGNTIWFVLEAVLGQAVPFPSLADVGFLGSIPFAVAAVLSWREKHSKTLVIDALQGLVLGFSLLIVSWSFILRPLIVGSGLDLLGKVLDVTYPFSDVLLLSLIAFALSRWVRSVPGSVVLLGLGFATNLVSDSTFTYLTLKGAYGITNCLDSGWLLGYALIACAPAWPWTTAAAAQPIDTRVRSGLMLIIPYIGFGGAIAAAADAMLSGRGLDPVLLVLAVTVVALVLTVQLLAVLQNRRWARAVARQERWFRALFQSSSDAVLVTDPHGKLLYTSSSAGRLLGVRGADGFAELLGSLDEATLATLHAGRQQAAAAPGSPATVTVRLDRTPSQDRPADRGRSPEAGSPAADPRRRPHVGRRTLRVTLTDLTRDRDVAGIVINVSDISAEATMAAQLTHRALHDPLTGVANRTLFSDRLANTIERHTRQDLPFAVLCLDLNSFKAINDNMGHAAGDAVLRGVGRRLARTIRGGDTVARLGGDEFAVILEEIPSPDSSRRAAQRIAAAISRPSTIEGKTVSVHSSIGICEARGGPIDADELLRRADVAMYEAKASGGLDPVVTFSTDLHRALLTRQALRLDLGSAVARDQLRLEYQPIIDLTTGVAGQFEALVRWAHPGRGVVAPREFLAVAEETGQIVGIGAWVLRRACRDLAQLQLRRPTSPPLGVHVNVSARELHGERFAADVAQTLADYELPPRALTLEISETLLMGSLPVAGERFQALRELGCRIAIDNFGSGHLSISCLKDFRLDEVKIDRGFLTALESGPNDRIVANAVIRVCHELGLVVVAQGVETPAQAALVRHLGCDQAQGFLFARALPALQLDAVLGDDLLAHAPAG